MICTASHTSTHVAEEAVQANLAWPTLSSQGVPAACFSCELELNEANESHSITCTTHLS